MRLKHKKLKKRYNELENSIYEDVDNDTKPVVDAGNVEVEPQQHVQSSAARGAAEQETVEKPPETHENTESEQPAYTQKRRLKRTSWRDAVEYM